MAHLREVSKNTHISRYQKEGILSLES